MNAHTLTPTDLAHATTTAGTEQEPPGRIVVGIDGSQAAHSALIWAARWAVDRGEPLHVLTADPSADETAMEPDAVAARTKELADLIGGSATTSGELDLSHSVAWVDPVTALVEASRDASFVVMGTRGAGGWQGALGSVSAAVAAQAHCPVVVVPPSAVDAPYSGKVVVGVDPSAAAAEAVEVAATEALRRGTPLVVAHAWEVPMMVAVSILSPKPDAGDVRVIDEVIQASGAAHPDLVIEKVSVSGSPAKALADVSAGAAMLVVGTRGRGAVAGMLLGSVGREIAASAPCPVMVVRTGLTEPAETS